MNSTTKIIAGVAVLALLFVAVGYAVETSYTAQTSSSDNTVGVAYIVLNGEQNELLIGPDSNIPFDTETTYDADSGEATVTYTAKACDLVSGNIVIDNTNVTADEVTIVITDNSEIFDSGRFSLASGTVVGSYNETAKTWTLVVPLSSDTNTIPVTFSVLADVEFTTDEFTTLAGGVSFGIAATATVA